MPGDEKWGILEWITSGNSVENFEAETKISEARGNFWEDKRKIWETGQIRKTICEKLHLFYYVLH